MRILLVEDHGPTREEMRDLLETQPDMKVVAEAASGEAGVDKAASEHPDLIVMDILLPGINGLEATRRILAASPGTPVLALSNHFGDSLIQSVFAAGCLGYVRKNRAFEELISAVRSVSTGQRYISQDAR